MRCSSTQSAELDGQESMTDIAMDSMVIKANQDACGNRHLPFVSPEGRALPPNPDGYVPTPPTSAVD